MAGAGSCWHTAALQLQCSAAGAELCLLAAPGLHQPSGEQLGGIATLLASRCTSQPVLDAGGATEPIMPVLCSFCMQLAYSSMVNISYLIAKVV